MIDNKSKDDIAEMVGRNCIKIIDEFTKAQPQYAQSVSNLQLEYIAAAKNAIENMISAQKDLAGNLNVHLLTPPYANEFVKQSNDIAENLVKAVHINNNLTANVMNAGTENVRALNRTMESVTEFNTSAVKAWNSFLAVQQEQFLHKQ
jgi:hypothetical protein